MSQGAGRLRLRVLISGSMRLGASIKDVSKMPWDLFADKSLKDKVRGKEVWFTFPNNLGDNYLVDLKLLCSHKCSNWENTQRIWNRECPFFSKTSWIICCLLKYDRPDQTPTRRTGLLRFSIWKRLDAVSRSWEPTAAPIFMLTKKHDTVKRAGVSLVIRTWRSCRDRHRWFKSS